jgi:uncharacterized protein (TIGR01568 family)
VVLVKQSAEPEEDFLASTREMIAANRSLRGLLACYLADHHRAIVAAPLACRRRRGRHWLSFPLSQCRSYSASLCGQHERKKHLGWTATTVPKS